MNKVAGIAGASIVLVLGYVAYDWFEAREREYTQKPPVEAAAPTPPIITSSAQVALDIPYEVLRQAGEKALDRFTDKPIDGK